MATAIYHSSAGASHETVVRLVRRRQQYFSGVRLAVKVFLNVKNHRPMGDSRNQRGSTSGAVRRIG
jgi:hypothetical protein